MHRHPKAIGKKGVILFCVFALSEFLRLCEATTSEEWAAAGVLGCVEINQ
jgi:hypothetical protein